MSLLSMRRYAVVLAGLVGLASCEHGTGPSLEGAEVRISLGQARYDEQTIGVGATLVLKADVYDATGKVVGGHTFQWSSADPGIASVTQAGVVTGISVGTTRIIARHDVGEDTALVNVAQPLTGTPDCSTGARTFVVGTPEIFTGAEAAAICLPGSGEYSMVVVNAGTTASAILQTKLVASGVRNPIGPPTPLLAPALEPSPPRLTMNEAFHQRLRGEVSERLLPRLQAGVDALQPTAPRLQVSAGQVLDFNVDSSSMDGCSAANIDRRGARVRLVSQRAVIVEDTLNPSGGFTNADYQEFANLFDNEIWPLLTSTFGEPTDIDNNGKVFILFTRAVNERKENSTLPGYSGSYVGGFAFNRDLFPTTGRSACKGSNAAEMFYMRVPDPNGVIVGTDGTSTWNARPVSVAAARNSTPGVLVHEFQHLINDSRRLHITKSLVWEETWLNEGLSHIAEELMFFDQAVLPKGQNLNAATFVQNATARAEFERFQLANLDRFAAMLRQPAQSSFMGEDALTSRGAAWSFLRYIADRRGGDETAFWRGLVRDARTSGLDNLERVLGEDPRGWMTDWAAALYLDDVSGITPPARYQLASWNFRDIYPAAGNLWPGSFYNQYPLQVSSLSLISGNNYSLQGGSTFYLRTGVATGGMGAVRVTVGNLPPPSRLRVVVTKLR